MYHDGDELKASAQNGYPGCKAFQGAFKHGSKSGAIYVRVEPPET